MIASKGLLSFRQFIPANPTNCGIKMFGSGRIRVFWILIYQERRRPSTFGVSSIWILFLIYVVSVFCVFFSFCQECVSFRVLGTKNATLFSLAFGRQEWLSVRVEKSRTKRNKREGRGGERREKAFFFLPRKLSVNINLTRSILGQFWALLLINYSIWSIQPQTLILPETTCVSVWNSILLKIKYWSQFIFLFFLSNFDLDIAICMFRPAFHAYLKHF